MKRLLEGRTALVTGGASGIGRATALAFAREGAKVVVVDVNVQGGEETVRLLREDGGEAFFIKCDVSKTADIEAMIKKTVDTYGRLDCAFNNAGIGVVRSTVDCTEEEWDRVINVNLKSVWLCMKYEIPQMLKQGSGAIVNTSSAAALKSTAGHSPYTVSKAGVIALTKVAALDCASAGIRVNAVCPGGVRTPMLEPLISNKQFEDFMLNRIPVKRIGKPEEIAEAVLWLCSDLASFVTGVALPVDGGTVAS
jgi:NAD(P)-dependent dehydrogenase (short-subunit alcohol dehydrogenase family)